MLFGRKHLTEKKQAIGVWHLADFVGRLLGRFDWIKKEVREGKCTCFCLGPHDKKNLLADSVVFPTKKKKTARAVFLWRERKVQRLT